MMMMSALYYTKMDHWNNSLQVDTSLHSHIILIYSYSLQLHTEETTNTKFIVVDCCLIKFHLTRTPTLDLLHSRQTLSPDQDSNSRSTALEADAFTWPGLQL
jgi:hypothetical protein